MHAALSYWCIRPSATEVAENLRQRLRPTYHIHRPPERQRAAGPHAVLAVLGDADAAAHRLGRLRQDRAGQGPSSLRPHTPVA